MCQWWLFKALHLWNSIFLQYPSCTAWKRALALLSFWFIAQKTLNAQQDADASFRQNGNLYLCLHGLSSHLSKYITARCS